MSASVISLQDLALDNLRLDKDVITGGRLFSVIPRNFVGINKALEE